MKESSAQKLKNINITNEEVMKYDRMIREQIDREILKYWANGYNPHSNYYDIGIGRLGMSIDDLMQIGREYVMKQLRWFKQNNANRAKESTMMYSYLRYKFQSLSRIYANNKHGGQVTRLEEHRHRIQEVVNQINLDTTIEECERLCVDLIHECQLEIGKSLRHGLYKGSKFKYSDPNHIKRYLLNRIAGLASLVHVSYDDIQEAEHQLDSDPETNYLVMESISHRMPEVERSIKPEQPKVKAPPRFCLPGTNFRMIVLAKKMGYKNQSALAGVLGVSITTLSNILHDRTDGGKELAGRIYSMFGEPIDSLRQVIPDEKIG
jgi:hypothetical protein